MFVPSSSIVPKASISAQPKSMPLPLLTISARPANTRADFGRRGAHARSPIVAVHREDRLLHLLRRFSRLLRKPHLSRVGRMADLVVDVPMHATARAVRRQVWLARRVAGRVFVRSRCG